MAKIRSDFGSGGGGITPHGSGEPSLMAILQDISDDINVAATARTAALAAIATADATDQASTNTLANAIKAKVNGELYNLAQGCLRQYYGDALIGVTNFIALITVIDASGGTTAPGIALLQALKAFYNGPLLALMTSLLAATPAATAPNITVIATADAVDLATSEALAIAIKGRYNGELLTLVNNIKTVIGAFLTKTTRGAP